MTTIDEIKVHWFCFSFSGVHAESGRDATACTYVGYSDSKITMPKINAQKIQSSLTENAILISVSPLGYMTKAEFTGEIDSDRD